MPLTNAQCRLIPKSPGVYLMQNRRDKVIYVGKAIDLQARVQQYLVPGRDGRAMVPYLVCEAERVETIVVSSEVEALLLENTLIKRHQPKFNALLKDDKGFSGIFLDLGHSWPAMRFMRVRDRPPRKGLFFGPYINAWSARQTLELAQRVFPLRQCSDEELARRQRPCLLYHMKRCCAPCVDLCSKAEYDEHVQSATRFLRGDRRTAVQMLERGIERSCQMLDFERAGHLHEMLKNLQQLQTGQGVDNPHGGDCDVFGIHRTGETTTLTRAQYRSGKLMGMQHRFFEGVASSLTEIYETMLPQLYSQIASFAEKAELPTRVIIGQPELNVQNLSRVLEQITGRAVRVQLPKIPDQRRWVELAMQNAAAQFEQSQLQRRARQKTLSQLQALLQLNTYPDHIECIDQSHLGATGGVSAIVCFREGQVSKRDYRRYKVDQWAGDDCAALQCALKKRLDRAQREGQWPDLFLIDGGRAQLNAASQVIEESNLIDVEVIGLSKERGRHDKGLTGETVHLRKGGTLTLEPRSETLLFLQRVRDEAHRFAIEYQKKRRSASMTRSILDDIPGVGPTIKKKLLRHFGSLSRLKQARAEELDQIGGLSGALKSKLREVLKLP